MQEGLTHQEQMCCTVNNPLRADDVKWDEISHLVNNCCPPPTRTVVRCRKRFKPNNLVGNHGDSLTTVVGPSTLHSY